MKTVKIIGLVVWGILTFSLILYGSTLRKQVEMQKEAIDKYLIGMSEMLDTSNVWNLLLEFKSEIDSLESELHERDSLISIMENQTNAL